MAHARPYKSALNSNITAKLTVIQISVEAVFGHEFIMVAGFNNRTMIHHDDVVSIANRGKSMCNNKTGAIRQQSVHGMLNMNFSSGIN